MTASLRAIALIIISILCLLWGCRAIKPDQPANTQKPAFDYHMDHFAGSPISGPVPVDVNTLTLEKAYAVTVTWMALNALPEDKLDPMESHTRLITRKPDSETIAPVARFAQGARFGTVGQPDAFISDLSQDPNLDVGHLNTQVTVLPAGVTALFGVMPSERNHSQGDDRLELMVSRAHRSSPASETPGNRTETVEIAFALSNATPMSLNLPQIDDGPGETSTNQPEQAAAPDSESQRITETIILQALPIDESLTLSAILPSPGPHNPNTALAALVTLCRLSPADPNQSALSTKYKACQADVKDHTERLNAPLASTQRPDLDQAMDHLLTSKRWRSLLFYLAQTTGAPVTREIALSASTDLARQVARYIYRAALEHPAAQIRALAWLLESQCYQVLIDQAEADQLPVALEAVLALHTGQVGRDPTTLKELINTSTGLDDFQRRLVTENTIYLDDMSPAARVRAFEWLKIQEQAPAGFDPLASLSQRRAALKEPALPVGD